MSLKIKYPRTFHVEWSPGATSDDKVQYDLSNFYGKYVVITEKMDGENTTMMQSAYYARSLDSNNHPSRNYVKGMWGKIKHNIPDGFRICGENLYAKHSIGYDNLEDYFLVFSIWENDLCLSWKETLEYCELLGLKTVPVLYEGVYLEEDIKEAEKYLDLESSEGYVIRLASNFVLNDFSKSVVKWVRSNHVQTDEHWTRGIITPNGLR